MAGLERLGAADQLAGNPRRVRAAEADHAETAAARRAWRSRRWCRRWKTLSSQYPVASGQKDKRSWLWILATGYFTEMMTVFSNASPMLSEVTDSSSATARWTMRRS